MPSIRAGLVALCATALVLITAGPANAAKPAASVIAVVGTSAGFTMADSHPAGQVTFEASSSHPDGGWFALWKLRSGATLDEALNDANDQTAEGGRRLQNDVEVLGGAMALPGQPASFTSLLLPGAYYMVNLRDLVEGGVAQAAPRLHSLTITSQWRPSHPPRASATVVFTQTGSVPGYVVPAELRSGQAVRMVNAMPQMGEAIFLSLRPGTTQEQVQEWFANADRGDWGIPAPYTSLPVGMPSLSPGKTTIVEVSLQPGQYIMVSWYPDFGTGHMLAAEGQFRLVTIV